LSKSILTELYSLMAPKSRAQCLKILGLSDAATEEEIKKAYRQKALEIHPDKNHNDPKATERFQDLYQAYQTLLSSEEDVDELTFEMFMQFIFAMQMRQAQFEFNHDRQTSSYYTCDCCGRRFYQPNNSYQHEFDEEFGQFYAFHDLFYEDIPYRPKQRRSNKKKKDKKNRKQKHKQKSRTQHTQYSGDDERDFRAFEAWLKEFIKEKHQEEEENDVDIDSTTADESLSIMVAVILIMILIAIAVFYIFLKIIYFVFDTIRCFL